jgi:hypothetical protein
MNDALIWRKCGSCKKPIPVKHRYYTCSISTCKKSAYCSMECFDEHSPIFRHKDAWAEELISPAHPDSGDSMTKLEHAHIVKTVSKEEVNSKDILVVASKLKDYIRTKSGMNTSQNVLARLSDMLRVHCDKAIEHAVKENRKTVMDRDFHM